VRSHQISRHLGTQFALLGMGVVGHFFRHGFTVWIAVHIEVIHNDQFRPVRCGGSNGPGLQWWEEFRPFAVCGIHGVVEHSCSCGCFNGKGRVSHIATKQFNPGRQRFSRFATAVDHADGNRLGNQFIHDRHADRAGAKNNV
jgi:hypothetical protein